MADLAWSRVDKSSWLSRASPRSNSSSGGDNGTTACVVECALKQVGQTRWRGLER